MFSGTPLHVSASINSADKAHFPTKKAEETSRRNGDPPVLVANNFRIKEKLNWKPAHDDLEYIVRTAWEWEKKR
jgi:UDP-glucose 4-epimerase